MVKTEKVMTSSIYKLYKSSKETCKKYYGNFHHFYLFIISFFFRTSTQIPYFMNVLVVIVNARMFLMMKIASAS